jgi:hypothetical protein
MHGSWLNKFIYIKEQTIDAGTVYVIGVPVHLKVRFFDGVGSDSSLLLVRRTFTDWNFMRTARSSTVPLILSVMHLLYLDT